MWTLCALLSRRQARTVTLQMTMSHNAVIEKVFYYTEILHVSICKKYMSNKLPLNRNTPYLVDEML